MTAPPRAMLDINQRVVDDLIDLALQEDIGSGDITTQPLIPRGLLGNGTIIAKEPQVIAGLGLVETVFRRLDPAVVVTPRCQDGDRLTAGATVVDVQGRLTALLTAERTALNFVQRLSGIATWVRSHVEVLDAYRVRLVDTRKTMAGWRVLEKYAVRVGGAQNHRMGLYDGVLIKDNHIAVCGGISTAVRRVRRTVSHLIKIEVEVSDLAGVHEALAAEVDVIMLDNMDLEQIRAAVACIDRRALVEVSGGITRGDLKSLAATGVDLISVGALTHSARCVDLSMRLSAL